MSSSRTSLVRRVAADCAAYRGVLIGYTAVLLVAALSNSAVPLVTQHLVDDGLRPRNLHAIVVLGLILVGWGIVGAVSSSTATAWGIIIGGRVIADLRVRLYRHLQSMPLAFFARTPAGALSARVNTDVLEAQSLVRIVFGGTAANIVTIVVAAASMVAVSPIVAAAAFVAAVPLAVLVRSRGRRVRDLARGQAAANRDMQSYLSERLGVGGALLGLLFGHRDRDLAGFRETCERAQAASVARNSAFAVASLALGLFGATGYGIAYVLGGLAAVHGTLSVGSVIALAGLIKLAYDPLITLAAGGINVTGGLVAFERVYELLDLAPTVAEPADPRPLPRPPGALRFEHVWFRHPDAAQVTLPSLLDDAEVRPEGSAWTLQDISFVAAAGTTTALVGATGAGKTTLTMLAARLYDPTHGAVRLGGTDVREVSGERLRRSIGVVTQDVHLFHDTLAVNLRVAAPDAPDEDLLRACERACLTDVLERLPAGLETVMGDRGYRLSGGERQRVALARVFLQEPDVVILDEATAHLDTRTERAVRSALRQVLAGRTLLVVAHRLSTVADADRILVLDRGRIVEEGTHADLLRTGTLYPRLHAAGSFDGPDGAAAADQDAHVGQSESG